MSVGEQLGLLSITDAAKLANAKPEAVARQIAMGKKLRSTTIGSEVWLQRESFADALLDGTELFKFYPATHGDWLASTLDRGRFYTSLKKSRNPQTYFDSAIHEFLVSEARSSAKTSFRKLGRKYTGLSELASFYANRDTFNAVVKDVQKYLGTLSFSVEKRMTEPEARRQVEQMPSFKRRTFNSEADRVFFRDRDARLLEQDSVRTNTFKPSSPAIKSAISEAF